jgi:hypothetical protein
MEQCPSLVVSGPWHKKDDVRGSLLVVRGIKISSKYEEKFSGKNEF